MKNNLLGVKKETNSGSSNSKQRDVSNSGVSSRKIGNSTQEKKGGDKPEKSSSSIQVVSSAKLTSFSPTINSTTHSNSPFEINLSGAYPGNSPIVHSYNNSKTLSSSGVSSINGGGNMNLLSTQNTLNTNISSSISNSQSFTPSSTNSGNIMVISRFRPLNEKEKVQSKNLCVEFTDTQQLSIRSVSENNIYKFSFDRIFDMNCTQQEVYDVAAKPIIDSVLEGFNGTILAYGQTSSGKTHTMQGVFENPEKEGIIPRMIRNVFNYILHSSSEIEFTVKVSMIEIYMEKIGDLIDQNRVNLNIREDKMKGIFIEDLSEHYVSNEEEVLELMKVGSDNRAIGSTEMNDQSSRSHSIFIMSIHQNNIKDLVAKTGKLYLVDLAGSEKISKTGATGMTLEEGKMINKSLTTLGMVINNLTDNKSQYVPYRDSKLTRVLQESLGGNSKTCLIITCSPSVYNEAETLSTLRFGLRAKKIKNKPKINKEVTVAELKIEIDKLGKLLLICNQRIGQLEGFIKFNGLTPPQEGDFSYEKNDKKGQNSTEKKNNYTSNFNSKKAPERTISILEEEIKKLKDEDLIANETMNLGSVYFKTDGSKEIMEDLEGGGEKIEIVEEKESGEFNENSQENRVGTPVFDPEAEAEKLINKETIRELTAKYSEMMALVSTLEDDKKELNDKLENAFTTIKENTDTIEQKERLIEDLENAKQKLEEKEKEFNEKIQILQQRLEIEKHAIKVSVDLVNDDPNLNDYKNNRNKNLASFVQSLQPTPYDDVYSKIQEVMLNKDRNLNDNDHMTNLQSLFETMKSKFNNNGFYIESEKNSPNVTMIEKSSGLSESNHIPKSPIRDSNSNSDEKEIFRKERKKFETEKKLILKALEERAEKIVQVENDNKELKERIKLLESKMNPDDKNYVKKIVSLEKNLEQVNLMYHQVVTQKSVLKIENQVLEKKIKKRNETINVYEKENNDLKEQLRMRDEKLSYYQKSFLKSFNAPNNVVKVIKGGSIKQTMGTGDIFLMHSGSNINSGDLVDPSENNS